jgi:hypothetical protein
MIEWAAPGTPKKTKLYVEQNGLMVVVGLEIFIRT